jgi:putative tricarboxylic transport membrane protein
MSQDQSPGDSDLDASDESASAASNRTLEIITALAFLALGLVVMWDSYRIGNGWGSDGPQSGYFPFYIGLLMSVATAVNLVKAVRVSAKASGSFVSKVELNLVLAIFLPCLVYVGVMQVLGLYVASAIFIAVFMRWQGKFSVFKSVACGLGVTVALFLMFEIWFTVPLLKGPLEAALGY